MPPLSALVVQSAQAPAYTTLFQSKNLETADHFTVDVSAEVRWEIKGDEAMQRMAAAFLTDMRKLGVAVLPTFVAASTLSVLLFDGDDRDEALKKCLAAFARSWGVHVTSASVTRTAIPEAIQQQQDAQLLAALHLRLQAHRDPRASGV